MDKRIEILKIIGLFIIAESFLYVGLWNSAYVPRWFTILCLVITAGVSILAIREVLKDVR